MDMQIMHHCEEFDTNMTKRQYRIIAEPTLPGTIIQVNSLLVRDTITANIRVGLHSNASSVTFDLGSQLNESFRLDEEDRFFRARRCQHTGEDSTAKASRTYHESRCI